MTEINYLSPPCSSPFPGFFSLPTFYVLKSLPLLFKRLCNFSHTGYAHHLREVKRYGPKDWSSIRSKGLLQRTRKSCRLRWGQYIPTQSQKGRTIIEEVMVSESLRLRMEKNFD